MRSDAFPNTSFRGGFSLVVLYILNINIKVLYIYIHIYTYIYIYYMYYIYTYIIGSKLHAKGTTFVGPKVAGVLPQV